MAMSREQYEELRRKDLIVAALAAPRSCCRRLRPLPVSKWTRSRRADRGSADSSLDHETLEAQKAGPTTATFVGPVSRRKWSWPPAPTVRGTSAR